jgi:hypothetical protein
MEVGQRSDGGGALIPIHVGRHSNGDGAAFRKWWGAVPNEVGQAHALPHQACQSISGDDASVEPAFVAATELAACTQRFSSSSIRRRTCSQ